MELAGNIVQSMGKFLNIADLQTSADFPQELDKLQQIFSQVIFFRDTGAAEVRFCKRLD